MKEQFAPSLAQKQAQLRAQYGPDFVLQPEQDPEFYENNSRKLTKIRSAISRCFRRRKRTN